jgi:hypothetical protein
MTVDGGAFDASLYLVCTEKVIKKSEGRFEDSERTEFTYVSLLISAEIYH